MRSALERHDSILRAAIDGHGGYVFSTGGDGFGVAFPRAGDAIEAAVEAQTALAAESWPEGTRIRVRGLHTGEVAERGGDYFGTAVNQAARLMTVGHGGQVLVSAVTAGLVGGEVKVVDLGEHRLRDLSGATRVFQVHADGLRVKFPRLRTVDAAPGNLPVRSTKFVGRDAEVAELVDLVRANRLMTLTGVGGVGKTRLAVQVAAELVTEFPDGVWLVELAPVSEPGAVADAAATTLGITPQAGFTVAEAVARGLSGRQLLVVDNCEHVLGAAAELVEAILARTTNVAVLATSREGLRVAAEHLWPVPSLDTRAGVGSAGEELFVERARAVGPGFALATDDDAAAVEEGCRRLDGIALAIELAAARMVSMSPQEVRDRLGDRFRLLSGSRRGLERHQTLRHAVGWSYELLGDDERAELMRCAVFAGGFDLAAALAVSGGLDEYAMLDVLDSLVRKSLVIVERSGGHVRYGMLETIRQFAEDQLGAAGTTTEIRERHARYYADKAVACSDVWDGPRQRDALDWLDIEYANLRAAFRWAVDRADLATAAAIATYTSVLGQPLGRFESVGWAEEILSAATAAELGRLPRLYDAASLCAFTGRPEVALRYIQVAVALQEDPHYDPFEPGWAGWYEFAIYLVSGRIDRCLDKCASMVVQPGFSHVLGLCGQLAGLQIVGRVEEAQAIADEAVATARTYGNPYFVSMALAAYGRAFIQTDPVRALNVLRDGLVHAQENRLGFMEATMACDAAGLEAVHGDRERALSLFDATIDAYHRAGNIDGLTHMMGNLAVFFDRSARPDVAATVYGIGANRPSLQRVIDLPGSVEHLRSALGDAAFAECAAIGAAMDLSAAVSYAHHQIHLARRERDATP